MRVVICECGSRFVPVGRDNAGEVECEDGEGHRSGAEEVKQVDITGAICAMKLSYSVRGNIKMVLCKPEDYDLLYAMALTVALTPAGDMPIVQFYKDQRFK